MAMEPIVYNKIGTTYNSTRMADPYILGRLYDLLQANGHGNYLDIGCGTGNYTIKLAEQGLRMTGIEPSVTMLNEAMMKSSAVNWVSGAAENIPFPDDSFDGAIATFTTHHWSEPKKAFSELWRVLKPDAKLVILTFTPQQEQSYWLAHYFPGMIRSTANRPISYDVVMNAATGAGFDIAATEKYFVQESLTDLFCYAGKHNPEIYFDQQVRDGISSFALFAHREEVEQGLKQLRQDIDTGRFAAIKEQHENDLGDYIFVVLRKG